MNDLVQYEKNVWDRFKTGEKERSEEQIVLSFCEFLRKELPFRRGEGLDCHALKVYYRNLLTFEERIMPLGVLGYAQRLSPLISELCNEKRRLSILDAGSGYGTESLLFASLGHSVVGLELVPERVSLARSRLSFFEQAFGFSPELNFLNANIFQFLKQSDPFDMIWTMEAVSHIFPPENYLKLAFQKLKPGGLLVISDPNGLNPLAWARSVKIRGSFAHSPHTRFKDPETGCPVEYGQEKIYPYFKLRRMLRTTGFQVTNTQISGFLCSSFLPKNLQTERGLYGPMQIFQRVLMKTPVLQFLGSIYTITAKKPSS